MILIILFFFVSKAFPTLSIIVNNRIINQSDTIDLTVSDQQVYEISCLSVYSKPDVNLELYDTNSLVSLSDGKNSIQSSSSCSPSSQLCSRVLQVNFKLTLTSNFLNMRSLSCTATSVDPQVNLTSTIQRKTNIINNMSTCFMCLCFFTFIRKDLKRLAKFLLPDYLTLHQKYSVY